MEVPHPLPMALRCCLMAVGTVSSYGLHCNCRMPQHGLISDASSLDTIHRNHCTQPTVLRCLMLADDNVVFGHVNLQSSANVLEQLERIPTDSKNNRPRLPVTIVDCGVTDQNNQECERENQAVNEQEDKNEIDLEQEEEEEDDEE